MGGRIIVPPSFAEVRANWAGDAAAAEAEALARLGESYLDRWDLTPDGAAMHGMASLIQPVRRADGSPGVLKVPVIDIDQPGEAAALRAWDGDGAVRIYDEDPHTWVMLLERLEPRDLEHFKDDLSATRILCALLRRLHAHAAPSGIPRLADVAAKMVADAPGAATRFDDPAQGRVLRYWADATAEVLGEAGDRPLHWDLHFENVLAAEREPWLAIDPKPLLGDPAFDVLPALGNRWDEIVASGDPARAVRRRYDLMIDELALEPQGALAWTYARLLQNAIWQAEDGDTAIDAKQLLISEAIGNRQSSM
ncbi:MAG TPA: aminoglycoside phosphotransferase family protein [Micromonosporaceae bacterium]